MKVSTIKKQFPLTNRFHRLCIGMTNFDFAFNMTRFSFNQLINRALKDGMIKTSVSPLSLSSNYIVVLFCFLEKNDFKLIK